MAKLVNLTYNDSTITSNQLLDNSAIIYNNTTIKSNFTGTAIANCNDKIMQADIIVGNVIQLTCNDKYMNSNIIAEAATPTIWNDLSNITWSKSYTLTWNKLVEV